METYYYVVTLDNDGTGVKYNSIVPEPAIEENYMLFSLENGKKKELFEENNDKRLITGPIMIPNKKILRAFSDGSGYYWCIFTEETLDIVVKKMAKEGNFNKVSLNHWQNMEGFDTSKALEGIYMTEIFILNDRNKSELFNDLPDGTIMATYWVEDETLWNDVIKSGKFNGFSVEITVDVYTEDEIKEGIFKALEKVLDDQTMSVEDKKSVIEDLFPTPKNKKITK